MYTALPQSESEVDIDALVHFSLPIQEVTCWTKAEELLLSTPAQLFVALLIVANAAVIGLETDLPDLVQWAFWEHLFVVFFTAELFAKLIIIGPRRYFSSESPDFFWNVFDFLIVSMGLVDVFVHMRNSFGQIGQEEVEASQDSTTVFRIMRLLRILRIFRIVRFLRQLYMLAFGFALAAVAVFWVTFLMTFVLYVCSIVLVRAVRSLGPTDEHYEFLSARFGNIVQSMLTLFEIMSSPDLVGWKEVLYAHPMLAIFLVFFIIFGSFGMIALLTGVIMESMFEKNQLKKEEERKELNSMRELLLGQFGTLFDHLPQQANGEASRSCVACLLPQIRQLFERQGIVFAQDDIDGMLDVIDAGGRGTVSREEFLHFTIQMADPGVRPMLIMELYYTVAHLRSRLERCERGIVGLNEQGEKGLRGVEALGLQFETQASCQQTAFREALTEAVSELRQHISESTARAKVDSCEDVMRSLCVDADGPDKDHILADGCADVAVIAAPEISRERFHFEEPEAEADGSSLPPHSQDEVAVVAEAQGLVESDRRCCPLGHPLEEGDPGSSFSCLECGKTQACRWHFCRLCGHYACLASCGHEVSLSSAALL